MKRIAKFHKVSFEQFAEGWLGEFPDSNREEAGRFMKKLSSRVGRLSVRQGMIFCPVRFCAGAWKNDKDTYRNPGGNGRRLGVEMLPEEWTGIQIPPSA